MRHRGGFWPRRVLAIFALATFAATACTSPALAEKRVALVVGNGAYQNAPRLPNPKNDAEDVAAALKRSGFETIVGLDLDKAGMDNATIRFARAAREADVAIFYYSGHAMQFSGVNYLMPVDAKLTDEADLRRMARVDDIVADVQQAKNLRILVLDSCRDNPLAEELKRSIGRTRAAAVQRGLAKIDSPQGMIVAYSTQAGRTAEDGQGRNSPYTAAFLKHIEATAEIGTVFRRVSADVYEDTKRTQLPELSLSLIGEFYLRGRPEPSSPIAATQPTVSVPSPSNEAAGAWGEIKNTSNPTVFEAFVRRFGDSFYGDLARARLDELKKSQAAAVAPPIQPTRPAPAPQAVTPSTDMENGPVLLGAEGDRARARPGGPNNNQSAAVVSSGLDDAPVLLGAEGDRMRARLDELKKSQAAAVAPPIQPTRLAPAPQAATPSTDMENGPVLLGVEGDRARARLGGPNNNHSAPVVSSGLDDAPVLLGAEGDRRRAGPDELKKSQAAPSSVVENVPVLLGIEGNRARAPQATIPPSVVGLNEPTLFGAEKRARLNGLNKNQTAAVAPPVQPATPAPQAAIPMAIVGKDAILLGRYADWTAYSATPNGKKVCFALARFVNAPTGTRNPPREPTYLFVSTRPADSVKNEISITTDYSFSSNSDAMMEIGDTSYALYTQNRQAWIKNTVDGPKVLEALIRHPKVSIKGDPARGARPSDNYSQKGLAQALDRVAQECR